MSNVMVLDTEIVNGINSINIISGISTVNSY